MSPNEALGWIKYGEQCTGYAEALEVLTSAVRDAERFVAFARAASTVDTAFTERLEDAMEPLGDVATVDEIRAAFDKAMRP